MVQILSTNESVEEVHALATQSRVLQFKIRSQAREILLLHLCRLDLNYPPIAVGGISAHGPLPYLHGVGNSQSHDPTLNRVHQANT